MHALSINFTMSLPCSWLRLSKVLLLVSSSSFSDSSSLTHCSPPSLLMCTVPNLAHSPHFTQAMHSGSYWCPTLGTACDLWPWAAQLFPAAQPSDLSPLPIHLDDCAHFYLNSACCVSPLVTTNHVLSWTVSTQVSIHVSSHSVANSPRAVILFIWLLHHTQHQPTSRAQFTLLKCFPKFLVLTTK